MPSDLPASLPDETVIAPEAPWLDRWRAAVARNARDRFVQIGTVAPGGAPEVRTVVLHGLARDGRPYFVGDARAAKHAAIHAGSEVALCTWWPKSSEQFRLRGPVDCVTSADAPWGRRRQELWDAQGADNRALFLGDPPGTPLERAAPPGEDVAKPPGHFVLYLLAPRRVDRLELGDPHRREIFELEDGAWHGGAVSP